MWPPHNTTSKEGDIMTTMEILRRARAAKSAMVLADTHTKNQALLAMADVLEAHAAAILSANALDLEAAKGTVSDVMLDRLALSESRIAGMAQGIREVAALPDPVGEVIRRVERPNGLVIERTAVPMGVIAIIYESRPNVTSDAAALAIKAGSACVLRGGKEAHRSAAAIVDALKEGLAAAGLPEDGVQLVEDTTRASANELMTARGYVDLLIPRGGAGLIRACVDNATVPVLETGTGICHIYVDKAADLDMALDILENAKCSRPSVCNAAEVCLVHKDVAEDFLPMVKQRLVDDRAARGLQPVELRLGGCSASAIEGTPPGPRALTPRSWATFWPSAWWTVFRPPSTISPSTPPATPRPSFPPTRRPSEPSPPGWTPPPSTSTPPPGSPTAASLAWAARWASPPRSSTPGAPWVFRSCVPLNMSSWAAARCGNWQDIPGDKGPVLVYDDG